MSSPLIPFHRPVSIMQFRFRTSKMLKLLQIQISDYKVYILVAFAMYKYAQCML